MRYGIGPNQGMRDLVAEKMTAQQIGQAQELARNWGKKKKTTTSNPFPFR